MPVIHMKHPKHGTKVAIAEEEATYDEKSGWTRFTPGVTTPEPVAPEVNQLTRRRRSTEQGQTDGDSRGSN